MAGMGLLDKNLDELEQRLAAARDRGSCLLCMGWGGGLSTKVSWLDTTNADYRQILEQFQIYNRALATNLPFPKPAASCSWATAQRRCRGRWSWRSATNLKRIRS